MSDVFRTCPFCGCSTNARAVACCERGARVDSRDFDDLALAFTSLQAEKDAWKLIAIEYRKPMEGVDGFMRLRRLRAEVDRRLRAEADPFAEGAKKSHP